MIELHRVSKVFSVGPVKVPALTDVSLRIGKGEFAVLTGASGAGKTTLLPLLYRGDLPGEVQVEALRTHAGAPRRSPVPTLPPPTPALSPPPHPLPSPTIPHTVPS